MNTAEPTPEPVDSMPAPTHLSRTAKSEWARLMDDLKRCGLVTKIDRAALAGYCQAYGTWVECDKAIQAAVKLERARIKRIVAGLEAGDDVGRLAAEAQLAAAGLLSTTTNGNIIQSVLLGARNRAMDLCLKFAAEFGMTPSARSRIDVSIGDTVTTQKGTSKKVSGGPESYLT